MREEIALAKAEMTEKTRKLAVGAAFAAILEAFLLFALIYLFEALAWAINDLLDIHRAGPASSSPAR